MKMDKKNENISKEAILAYYLTGTITYRALEAKYGIPSRSICDWVLEYQDRKPSWKKNKKGEVRKSKAKVKSLNCQKM